MHTTGVTMSIDLERFLNRCSTRQEVNKRIEGYIRFAQAEAVLRGETWWEEVKPPKSRKSLSPRRKRVG